MFAIQYFLLDIMTLKDICEGYLKQIILPNCDIVIGTFMFILFFLFKVDRGTLL